MSYETSILPVNITFPWPLRQMYTKTKMEVLLCLPYVSRFSCISSWIYHPHCLSIKVSKAVGRNVTVCGRKKTNHITLWHVRTKPKLNFLRICRHEIFSSWYWLYFHVLLFVTSLITLCMHVCHTCNIEFHQKANVGSQTLSMSSDSMLSLLYLYNPALVSISSRKCFKIHPGEDFPPKSYFLHEYKTLVICSP